MSCLAFPLRLKDARLRRCSEQEAIVALVQAMAWTPGGIWAGSAHFGLRDLLEDARRRGTLLPKLTAEINLGLTDLGITDYFVDAVEREASRERSAVTYSVNLRPKAGGLGYSFRLKS